MFSKLKVEVKSRKKYPAHLTDDRVIDHLLANNWERGWISQKIIDDERKVMEKKLRQPQPKKATNVIPGDYD